MADENKIYDRVELRFDERGIGRAAANGHDIRCTSFAIEVTKASADAEEVTILLTATVDAKVLNDLTRDLKPKIAKAAAAKSKGKEEPEAPEESPEEA